MASFSYEDGSQVDVAVEGETVVIHQALAGVTGRSGARLTASEALEVADAIVKAAEEAHGAGSDASSDEGQQE